MSKSENRTIDTLTQLKDAGAITASAAALVSASAAIVDLGTGHKFSNIILNVTAVKVSVGDEQYLICVQGSNSATFASGIQNLAIFDWSDAAVQSGASDKDGVVGQAVLPFTNSMDNGNTVYRYLRLYHEIAGTLPSINYVAYAGK